MHDGMLWHGGWMWIFWLLLIAVAAWLVVVTMRIVGRGAERRSRGERHDDHPRGANR